MSEQKDLLKGLNDQQIKAVTTTEGPVQVLAGAGSGKTKALTHRIAYLIQEKGISPFNILAITFTKKAANEMKERLIKLIGPEGKFVYISTFHSFCFDQVIRNNLHSFGYEDGEFKVIVGREQDQIIKDIQTKIGMNPKDFGLILKTHISLAKEKLMDPNEYFDYMIENENANEFFAKQIRKGYDKYNEKMKSLKGLDFDDMIMKSVLFLRDNQKALEYIQNDFPYLLVDEYQDTNTSQYELVKLLSSKTRNVFVVGDVDQSIYKFRGADISNILMFDNDFPDAELIKLEQNYRSTKNIINASNSLIEHNSERKAKTSWTANEKGEKVHIFRSIDPRDEAATIARIIERGVSNGKKYSDYCILYRSGFLSRNIEERLVIKGIPYDTIGSFNFYKRKEIQMTIEYMRAMFLNDSSSLEKIINSPRRGIGPTTINRLKDFARNHNLSLIDAMFKINEIQSIKGSQKKSIIAFIRKFKKVRKFGLRKPINIQFIIGKVVKEFGFFNKENKEFNDASKQDRIDNVEEFRTSAIEFDSMWDKQPASRKKERNVLTAFLDHLLLDVYESNDDEKKDAVKLSTIHSAKGLEFPIVFIIGNEGGIFPSNHVHNDSDLQEERRLEYVAMTRAEHELYLSSCQERPFGNRIYRNKESIFINEIDRRYTERIMNMYAYTDIKPGDTIIHKQLGEMLVHSINRDKNGNIIQMFVSNPENADNIRSYICLTEVDEFVRNLNIYKRRNKE